MINYINASISSRTLYSNSLNAIRCGAIVYLGAKECPDTSPAIAPVPTTVLTNTTVPVDSTGNSSQNTTPEVSPAEKTANGLNQKDSENTINNIWPPILVGILIPVISFLIIAFYIKNRKKPQREADIEGRAMQNLFEWTKNAPSIDTNCVISITTGQTMRHSYS